MLRLNRDALSYAYTVLYRYPSVKAFFEPSREPVATVRMSEQIAASRINVTGHSS
jgi:hypothetical protein